MKTALIAEIARVRKSSLAGNAGWMLGGQGLGFVLQAIYFVILARLLGASEYGVYAGAFALASMASVFSTLGSGTLFLRYVTVDATRFSVYWGNILAVTAVTSLLLVTLLDVIARRTMNSRTASIVVVAAIANCFCGQLITAAGQVFQTFEKMRWTALLVLLNNSMRVVAAVLMLLTMRRATAMQWAAASLVTSALGAIAAVVIVTVCFGRPSFRPKLFLSGASEGFGYSFASSTATAYNDLDKAMLSHYGMNAAAGIYTMAYRLVDIVTVPILALRDAAMPRFFRNGAASVQDAETLATGLLKRALPLAAAGSIAAFIVAPLIPMLVGHQFDSSVAALRWLCWIPLLRAIHQMTGSALTGAGLQKYRTATQCSCAVVNFGLNLWLIPVAGWRGAAWASLATDGLLGLLNWICLAAACRKQATKERAAGAGKNVLAQIAFAMIVGPGEAEMAIDTLNGVLKFYPQATIWIREDRTGDGTWEKLISWASGKAVHLSRNQRILGWKGLPKSLADLYMLIAQSDQPPAILVKMDPDAMLLRPGLVEIFAEKFKAAGPGICGSYKIGPTGARRSVRMHALKIVLDALPIGYSSVRKLRLLPVFYFWYLLKALLNGYRPGEHVLGGMYAIDGETLRELARSGFLNCIPAHPRSWIIFEDVLMSLGVKAVGHRLSAVNVFPTSVVAWIKAKAPLEITPGELRERGILAVHPIKKDQQHLRYQLQ